MIIEWLTDKLCPIGFHCHIFRYRSRWAMKERQFLCPTLLTPAELQAREDYLNGA